MPVSVYEGLIDWNADGDYLDTGEDVTARILNRTPIRLRRGLAGASLLDPIAAGEGSFELNNVSKDYTKLNAASPLAGNVKTGRPFQVRTAQVRDSFDRANGALGTADVGGAWTVVRGTFAINTNQAQVTGIDGGTGDAIAVVDAGHADGSLQVTIATVQDSQYVIFRYIDANNWLFVEVDTPNAVLLHQVEGGSLVTLTSAPHTWAAGDRIRIDLWGTAIRVYVNGLLRIGMVEPTHRTGTKYGLGKGNVAGTTNRFDDFKFTVPMLSGTVSSLAEQSAPLRKSVDVALVSRMARVIQYKVDRDEGSRYSTQLHTGIRTDEAIGYLLDAIGLTDTNYRVFDKGNTVLSHWWLDPDQDVFEVLLELVRSEGPTALLFEDGFGRIVFKSRTSIHTDPRRAQSQATLSAIGAEPQFVVDGYEVAHRERNVINDVRLTWRQRQPGALQVIWTRGAPISLAPDETIVVEVRASNQDERTGRITTTTPFSGAVAPVVNTDFRVASGSVTTPVLNRTSGSVVEITMTAGSGGAVIDSAALDGTGMQLRAQPLTVTDERLVVPTESVSASKLEHGSIPYSRAIHPEMPLATMQHIADEIVRLYKDGRFTVTLTLDNYDATRLSRLLKTEVGDRLHLVEDQASLDHDCQALVLDHTIARGGKHHQLLLSLEEAPPVLTPFLLDTSQLGPMGTHVLVG